MKATNLRSGSLRCSRTLVILATATVLVGCATSGADTAKPMARSANPPPSAIHLCSYSNDAVLSQSKVGKAANARLRQLQQAIQAKLQQTRASLQSDASAYQARAHKLGKTHRTEQLQELQQRQKTYQQAARQLDARLRYTRAVVEGRINETITPLVKAAYQQHACSILLKRSVVIGGGEKGNLTASVLAALDQKLTTVNFNLLALPQSKTSNTTGNSGK